MPHYWQERNPEDVLNMDRGSALNTIETDLADRARLDLSAQQLLRKAREKSKSWVTCTTSDHVDVAFKKVSGHELYSRKVRDVVVVTRAPLHVAGGGRIPVTVVERDSRSGRSTERRFSSCPERTLPVAKRAPAQRGRDLGQGIGDLPVHPAGGWHQTTSAISAIKVVIQQQGVLRNGGSWLRAFDWMVVSLNSRRSSWFLWKITCIVSSNHVFTNKL